MAEKTAEEIEKERQKQQKEVKPIETGEAIPSGSIQDLARKNYERGEALAKEGKQAPAIPATSVNLASFQNQESLPEEKRKGLEPVDIPGHPKAVERAKQASENKDSADKKKGQAFANIPATANPAAGSGSVTDELLGGGKK